MRVAFAGTPEFAAVALEAILAAGHEVPLVLTQPDRPAGRGMQRQPSPVKKVALAHGIPVDQPEKLRTPAQQAALAACRADVLVVAAYGLILPQAVLELPRLGCINIHASLLPRWRGAAPIHRAIEAGDAQTGITIMQMDAGLDTGPMLLKQATPILADDTTASLHDKLAALGGEMVVQALAALPDLLATPQPEEGVTYAAKIAKAEAAMDWRRPAVEIERAIRAFNPFPVASATLAGTPLKLWEARVEVGRGEPGTVLAADGQGLRVACGEGVLVITAAQKPGGRRLPVGELLKGFPVAPGVRFDLPAI
ncbi:MAG: methionyl-tRNA formyltransferase [Rhodocyclaceae bacterium]|jgi:methionyl-tRNA formyltransferase|nr:methionyl-tRNA formyltransferase [Rhodocyclaceae bacterium]